MAKCKIPLSPRDAKLLVRYLDGVDHVISARLGRGFNPNEDHLTSLLCEMLDDNLSELSALPYSLSSLREDLATDPRNLRVSVGIETRKYPPHIESRLTAADLGVVVVYQDHFVPTQSFEKGCLLQAKRLYRSNSQGQYTLDDRFGAFETAQLLKLDRLSRQHAPNSAEDHLLRRHGLSYSNMCYYLFYCPSCGDYIPASREEIQHHLVGLADIYDFAEGLHRHEYVNNPQRHVPGLLVSDLGWLLYAYTDDGPTGTRQARPNSKPPSARDAFGRMWDEVRPLSWFMVYHLLMGCAGVQTPGALAVVRGDSQVAADAPVLPRYVVTLLLEVGISPNQANAVAS